MRTTPPDPKTSKYMERARERGRIRAALEGFDAERMEIETRIADRTHANTEWARRVRLIDLGLPDLI